MTSQVSELGVQAMQAAIVAPASGSGAAAVSVLRLSGRHCHKLLLSCLQPIGKLSTSDLRAVLIERSLRLCRFIDPETQQIIDEPMVVLFHAPRSFTGEDAAEIHCHGGPYVVRRVLACLYRAGFRAAEPGEFTRRAYLNGKLDLTAAEGIKELVEAESEQQWLAARQLATGRLKNHIESIRGQLIEAMAYLEAQIDFPDEGDVSHLQRQHVRGRVQEVKAAIERLAATYDSGRVASQGLMVALFGRPNAGKSSLMNALLGKERAIVTAIAGTTRDYIEERCLINGRLLRLVDMAGVRESSDTVEKLGIEAALKLAAEADIVLFLASADADSSEVNPATEIEQWIQQLKPKTYLRLLNKADLAYPSWAKAKDDGLAGWVSLSCKTSAGLSELKAALAARVDAHIGALRDETFVTSARHAAALANALGNLRAFHQADQAGHYEEMLAFELQQAARSLRSLIGDVGNEDILDKVFGDFCIGK